MAVSIAIDGPAGAGKSTIAKLLAAKMNYIYVDTGAMYRAMAVYFTQNHVNPDDEREINAAVSNVDITIEYMDGVQQVILNGEPYKRWEFDMENSNMSGHWIGVFTAKGNETQIDFTENVTPKKWIMKPFVKIYLTASTQARAKRRFDELTQKGEQCNLEEIAADIESRDYADMHREISPLKQAEDAILVDTSDMNIEEVVAKLTQIIEEKKAS